MLKLRVSLVFTIFSLHIPYLYVLLYNKQLKNLEVLIRFLRCPECPFLLHCVEHSVAILSLVLVRETDDRQLSIILFLMYTYRKIYNLYYVCTFLNSMYTKALLF